MSELVTRERVGGAIAPPAPTTDALLPLLPIVSGTSNSEVATNYNIVSRIAVIAMVSPENIQLPETRFLRARCDGKTLAQLKPMPRQGGKKLIAIPAKLLNELNESQFAATAFRATEKAVESTSVSQDSI